MECSILRGKVGCNQYRYFKMYAKKSKILCQQMEGSFTNKTIMILCLVFSIESVFKLRDHLKMKQRSSSSEKVDWKIHDEDSLVVSQKDLQSSSVEFPCCSESGWGQIINGILARVLLTVVHRPTSGHFLIPKWIAVIDILSNWKILHIDSCLWSKNDHTRKGQVKAFKTAPQSPTKPQQF